MRRMRKEVVTVHVPVEIEYENEGGRIEIIHRLKGNDAPFVGISGASTGIGLYAFRSLKAGVKVTRHRREPNKSGA